MRLTFSDAITIMFGNLEEFTINILSGSKRGIEIYSKKTILAFQVSTGIIVRRVEGCVPEDKIITTVLPLETEICLRDCHKCYVGDVFGRIEIRAKQGKFKIGKMRTVFIHSSGKLEVEIEEKKISLNEGDRFRQ